MDSKLREAYETCIRNAAEIKRLTAESDAAKAEIKRLHAEIKTDMICEDGFQSTIVHSSRSTFDRSLLAERFAQIESALGIVIPEDMKNPDGCFRVSHYDSFTVKRLPEAAAAPKLLTDPIF